MGKYMAEILNGTLCAKTVRAGLGVQVQALQADLGITPRLDVILVGEDPGSMAYVDMKRKACVAEGMLSEIHSLAADSTQQQVLDLVQSLNANPAVHGILVQHPVPKHLDEQPILDSVSPEKDVDGISTVSLGCLVVGKPAFRACTPFGIMRLMALNDVPIEGKTAVVIGRSIILGKPLALMLMEKNATVTVCHSRTQQLHDVCRQADILVAAVGKAELVKSDWVKPGACVIDAGYTRLADGTHVGDVDYAAVSQVAGWITPVPGGVGPMTIAMLMENTVEAARLGAGTVCDISPQG